MVAITLSELWRRFISSKKAWSAEAAAAARSHEAAVFNTRSICSKCIIVVIYKNDKFIQIIVIIR